MSAPATSARPDVGGSSVVSIRKVVDLPAPFGPRNATSSPAAMSMSTPRTASTVSFLETKCLVSWSVWIIRPFLLKSYVRCTELVSPYTVRRSH